MTTPTETLRREHRIILRMLGCLEIVASRIRRGQAVDGTDLHDMARFFRDHADRCHHAKEENQLFPALERVGIRRDGGPIAVMLAEHDEGRASVSGMSEALPASGEGPGDLREFARHAGHLVSLLRDHIAKEDHVLLRMAEDALAPAALAELEEVFEKIRTLEIGQAVHDQLEAMAARFGETYQVAEQRNSDNLPGCAVG